MKDVRAVVLAAGEGTRMKSPLIKLLHRIDYQELVKFPVNACVKSGVGKIIVVVGHQAQHQYRSFHQFHVNLLPKSSKFRLQLIQTACQQP